MFIFLLFLLPIVLFFIKNSILTTKLPPGPNIYQFFRIISKYGKEPHIAFKHLANVYGPLISIRLGGQLLIVASSPAIAKEILKTNDRVFAGRYMPAMYYEVPQVSTITMSRECNDTWKFLRGIGQKHLFSSRAIDSNIKIRMDKVAQMMRYLVDREGRQVKLDDVITATITNVVSNILVSKDLFDVRGEENYDEKTKALVKEIVETIALPGLTDLFPILRYVDFWSKKSGLVLHQKIMSVWKDIINERRRSKCANGDTAKGDFLDVAFDVAFTDEQIGSLFTELLIGGTDSTNVTAIWTIVQLIKNKEILNKVRCEIDQAFEGDVIDESRLSASKYFQACIKETLRLHISGPFLVPHRATEKCNVGNYIIPKDTVVIVNAWAIQRDPNNWKDPLVFDPERFMDSNIDFRGNNFDFIPFSAGQRMCPGINMGLRNIQMVLAHLVHYFDWFLPNGEDCTTLDTKDKFGYILKKEIPLCVIPKLREGKTISNQVNF